MTSGDLLHGSSMPKTDYYGKTMQRPSSNKWIDNCLDMMVMMMMMLVALSKSRNDLEATNKLPNYKVIQTYKMRSS